MAKVIFTSTVREISIRTKHFIVKNKLRQVISEKHMFLINTFIIILKANLITILCCKKLINGN